MLITRGHASRSSPPEASSYAETATTATGRSSQTRSSRSGSSPRGSRSSATRPRSSSQRSATHSRPTSASCLAGWGRPTTTAPSSWWPASQGPDLPSTRRWKRRSRPSRDRSLNVLADRMPTSPTAFASRRPSPSARNRSASPAPRRGLSCNVQARSSWSSRGRQVSFSACGLRRSRPSPFATFSHAPANASGGPSVCTASASRPLPGRCTMPVVMATASTSPCARVTSRSTWTCSRSPARSRAPRR